MYNESDRIHVLVRKPAFLLSFSTFTRRKKILSSEGIHTAKSLVNTTHEALCLSGRSTNLKIKEVHTEPSNQLKSKFIEPLESIEPLFSIRLKMYFSSVSLKTFI